MVLRTTRVRVMWLIGLALLCLTATAAGGGIFSNRALAVDTGEIERRLALPPFAYVGETDYDTAKLQKGVNGYTGAAAFIDSTEDALVARPSAGTSLQGVAVAPDGSRFYMTDAYEPVLHVFDAETRQEIAAVSLPGVEPRDPVWMAKAFQNNGGAFPYSFFRSCANGVACTPDGSTVLAASSAGLQVIDSATNKVVRTFAEFVGGSVAVSFDGKRAYVDDDNFDGLAPRKFMEWFEEMEANQDGRVVCIDLETWTMVGETPAASVASIAVKPDDSQVFFSETYKKRVRVVDAFTLEDLWSVSTDPSYSIGIGFVPNGTKAYVVCSADNDFTTTVGGQVVPRVPTAEEYFCAVIDTAAEKIIKKIPLDAY